MMLRHSHLRSVAGLRVRPWRSFTTARTARSSEHPQRLDVEELLAKPTWSVSSLLPSTSLPTTAPQISSKQLHHLLRLSALPPPASPAEEAEMLATLSSQLHFVREIQRVDTTGVQPLQSVRDETAAGESEAELGLGNADIQEALAREEIRGQFHKRVRRRKNDVADANEKWDVLRTAGRKTGRYFVVEGGKEG